MLEDLKKEVCLANKSLKGYRLVQFTEGNVSAISEDGKYLVIKPSGVSYDNMLPDHMVVVNLEGNVVEGKLKPSTDMPTHLEVYKNYPQVRSIVHTHSPYATIFAQRQEPIECYGTTHADMFRGPVPVSRTLTEQEIKRDYEKNTGKAICEILNDGILAVLVSGHGPFVFGNSVNDAVTRAVMLEKIAFLALHGGVPISKHLLEKHYDRKHGFNRYYGQRSLAQK